MGSKEGEEIGTALRSNSQSKSEAKSGMVGLHIFLVFGIHLALGDDPCSGCSLQTYWGSEDSLNVFTRGIFAIWWDPKFDHESNAQPLFEILNLVRDDCLNNLGMADPPNPGKDSSTMSTFIMARMI